MSVPLSVRDVSFFVREVPMRMPFRFGVATLTSMAQLNVVMEVELADGTIATGLAADMLAPKWFDKDPAKTYSDNMRDLAHGAREAAAAYRRASSSPRSLFEIWREGYAASMSFADANSLNHLTGGHGSSLMERALMDGLGIALGVSYHQLLRDNLPGLDFGQIYPELVGVRPADVIADVPLARLDVRHTVGLADPLRTSDIVDGQRLDDGLPQALEEYLRDQGLKYLKIKVSGDVAADTQRLEAIADLLEHQRRDCGITLDGNEQYDNIDDLHRLLDNIENGSEATRRLYERILFIEQPLDRTQALDTRHAAEIGALGRRRPMVIDEADEDIDTFGRALELGYSGVSSKACKGLIKALTNRALMLCRDPHGVRLLLTGEDLTNIPVVSLHQDLAHLACLGISHAERNGHHYVRGLGHLSEAEVEGCRRNHRALYRTLCGDTQILDIRDGSIDLRSLQRPGLGVGVELDTAVLTALDDWRPPRDDGG